MGWLPDISFGTHSYPERIARRLRAVNGVAWGCALFAAAWTAAQSLDSTPGVGVVALANGVTAIVMVCVPLLHRFGPLAAPLGLICAAYTAVFVICAMIGTASGMQIQFLAIAASSVLYLGPNRVGLIGAVGVMGVALAVALEVLAPRSTGLFSPHVMLVNFVGCVVGTYAIMLAVVLYAAGGMERAEAEAEREFERSEALLTNILPASISRRLKSGDEAQIADKFEDASVLFADMEGYTARAGDVPPDDLVRFLNGVFTAFDQLVDRHGLEKIKTTGDAYMVVSGVPTPRADHAAALARLALDMREAALAFRDPQGAALPMRIGMASGPVVAGVVGTRRFFYDVWGDAVNVASRMELTGSPGMIQISDATRRHLGEAFVLEPRGEIEVKGKGPMRTWFLTGVRPA